VRDPIGVILAGGLGRRIGGSKAKVELGGRPLISYPLAAMRAALRDVAVIIKPNTELPALPGVTVWGESVTVNHPLVGIVEALALADGRPIVVCAVDLPFVTPALISSLAAADPEGAPAVVAAHGAELQPLLGCYRPAAGGLLAGLDGRFERPLRDTVAAIGPRAFAVDDPQLLFNVNSPDDLLQAAAMLDRLTRT
jgi:molybdenum cofactor guanylyltransferase